MELVRGVPLLQLTKLAYAARSAAPIGATVAILGELLDAARHLTGAKVLAARLYGVGPVTALAITCWLAGAGRFSSSRQAVRFAGPGHHRVLLRPQGPARAAVPAGAAGAALGGL